MVDKSYFFFGAPNRTRTCDTSACGAQNLRALARGLVADFDRCTKESSLHHPPGALRFFSVNAAAAVNLVAAGESMIEMENKKDVHLNVFFV